jgi:hypothetical protein
MKDVEETHYSPPVAHSPEVPFLNGNGEDEPHIVNVDFNYVLKQENFFLKCYNLKCLYDSTDFDSFIKLMPDYSSEEIMLNKIVEFKRSANLSRTNSNLLLELLNTLSPTFKIPRDIRSVTRFIDSRINKLSDDVIHKYIPWTEH